jgi:hypothetical protein
VSAFSWRASTSVERRAKKGVACAARANLRARCPTFLAAEMGIEPRSIQHLTAKILRTVKRLAKKERDKSDRVGAGLNWRDGYI